MSDALKIARIAALESGLGELVSVAKEFLHSDWGLPIDPHHQGTFMIAAIRNLGDSIRSWKLVAEKAEAEARQLSLDLQAADTFLEAAEARASGARARAAEIGGSVQRLYDFERDAREVLAEIEFLLDRSEPIPADLLAKVRELSEPLPGKEAR